MISTHRAIQVLSVLAFALAAAASAPAAGPQSVYGPSTPGDSAFVRVVNLLPDATRVSLGATRIGPVARGAVSSYYAVVPDIYTVRAGGSDLEVVPTSGSWTTLALTTAGIIAFDDPAHTDPARVQLFLYNLTALPSLDLDTADGKTAVIKAVKAGGSGQVVVNAVAVSLAVFSGTKLVKAAPAMALARGASWSLFALPEGSGVSVVAVKADVKVE